MDAPETVPDSGPMDVEGPKVGPVTAPVESQQRKPHATKVEAVKQSVEWAKNNIQELDRCVAKRFLVDNGSAKSLELR